MKKILVHIPDDSSKQESFEHFLQEQELQYEDYENLALDKVVHKKDFKIRLTAVVSLAIMLILAALAFWQMNETERYKRQWKQSLQTIELREQSLQKTRDSLFKREKEWLELKPKPSTDTTSEAL